MVLKELYLKNFRNYDTLKIDLSPNVNIIYGNNAQGKTNLLEAIYVLALTKSHRLYVDSSLIKKDCKNSKIYGIINDGNLKTKLEIIFEEDKKILKVDNQEIKKVNEYISNKFSIIIFYPEDLEIIKSSPAIRRNFLNVELSQISNNYLTILNDYNRLLKIRNDLLKKHLKTKVFDDSYFDIVTNYLIDKSILIWKMRAKFIYKLNQNSQGIFYNLSKMSNFNIKYVPSIILNFEDNNLKQSIYEQFNLIKSKEKRLGTTLIGPHRDDFEFYLDDKNLKEYGSQGQQRLAILSMKLAEIEIFKNYKETNPILLLDDVFSELDDLKKNSLIKYINDDIQVIITTTDLKRINKKLLNNAKIFKIKDGNIVKLEEVE